MPTAFGPRRARPPWRVGILCQSIANNGWAAEQVAQRAVEVLSKAGCLVRVVTMGPRQLRGANMLRWLRGLSIDGAVDIEYFWTERRGATAIPAWQFPIVSCSHLPASSNIEMDCVGVDEDALARLALDHLRAVGHAKCGYVVISDHFHVRQRLEAFARTARGMGMWDSSLVLDLREDLAKRPLAIPLLGRSAKFIRFFTTRRKPLALCTHNDFVAATVIESLGELGLEAPTDVAIVGVGNHPVFSHANVPLTSIELPNEQIGQIAAEMLLRRLQETQLGRIGHIGRAKSTVVATATRPPASVKLESRLVIRQSTLSDAAGGAWLPRVLEELSADLRRPVRLRELSRKVNMHPKTLSRKFRRTMRSSIPEYRNELRLDKGAALLLADLGAKVSSVATDVGFTSPGRFAALFQRRFGLSPKEYRRHRAGGGGGDRPAVVAPIKTISKSALSPSETVYEAQRRRFTPQQPSPAHKVLLQKLEQC